MAADNTDKVTSTTSEKTPTIATVSNFDELQYDLKMQLSNLRKMGSRLITCRIIELSTQHKNSPFISGKITDVKTNKAMEFSISENTSHKLHIGHTYDFEGEPKLFIRTANSQLNSGLSFNVRRIAKAYDTSKDSLFYNALKANQIISLLDDSQQKQDIDSILCRSFKLVEMSHP